jgi:plasmid stabilization system protein ParE
MPKRACPSKNSSAPRNRNRVRVTLHRKLAADLQLVRAQYLDESEPNLRNRFNDEFDRLLEAIIDNPKRFHFISRDLRRANFPTFPYHLLYRETADEVRILGLRHHRRDPEFGSHRK